MDVEAVMQAIVKEYANDTKRIAKAWADVQKVRMRLNIVYANMQDEIARHSEAMKAHRLNEQVVRADCPHWHRVYHGDPAGGSDSYSECDVCGETWR